MINLVKTELTFAEHNVFDDMSYFFAIVMLQRLPCLHDFGTVLGNKKSTISRPYPFKVFKARLPQNLLSPILNTLSQYPLNSWDNIEFNSKICEELNKKIRQYLGTYYYLNLLLIMILMYSSNIKFCF